MAKIFKHPDYKQFSGIYKVSKYKERVRNTFYNREIGIHKHKISGMKFVRLSGGSNGVCRSISLGRLILLTYKPHEYKKGLIACLKNYKKPVTLDNLFWGTRSDQTKIQLKNPKNYKRISRMAKKYYNTDEKDIEIKKLIPLELSDTQIAKKLNVTPACIYQRRIALGLAKPSGIDTSRKMTELKVANLRNLKKTGCSNKFLAKKYGISTSHVSKILLRKNWK